MKIGLIISQIENVPGGNPVHLHNAFLRRGDQPQFLHLPTIEIEDGTVTIMAAQPGQPIEPGADLRQSTWSRVAFRDLDLGWLLSHPHPNCDKDVYQILWLAALQVAFVNQPSSVLNLDSKHNLAAIVPAANNLPSFSTSDAGRIVARLAESKDRKWVIKPANLSNGASVFVLDPKDSNRFALAQMMTGNVAATLTTYGAARMGHVNRYCVVQAFNEAAAKSEKRVLLAGGKVIGAYEKIIESGDHRATMMHGSRQQLVELSPEETALAEQVAARMKQFGLHYGGMDLGYPYVYELNVMSPNGLSRLKALGGGDRSDAVVEAVLAAMKLA